MTTDANGNTTTTEVITQAHFSREPGHEQEFVGATQTTQVLAPDALKPTSATQNISQESARAAIGNAPLVQAAASATPIQGRYFATAVARDAKAHPGKYVSAAATIAAGPAGATARAVLGVIAAAGFAYDEIKSNIH
jgi:hypothetical protein